MVALRGSAAEEKGLIFSSIFLSMARRLPGRPSGPLVPLVSCPSIIVRCVKGSYYLASILLSLKLRQQAARCDFKLN